MRCKHTIIVLLILISSVSYGQVLIRSVYFDNDSYTLSKRTMALLDSLAEKAGKWPEGSIVLKGYTDSVAAYEYNTALSQKRAERVMAYLISKGISPGRITTQWYGESNPVQSNQTEKGRSGNRRVSLYFFTAAHQATDNSKVDSVKRHPSPENDTTIVSTNGTKILIRGGSFAPRQTKDIKIQTKEFNTTCDLVNSNISMITDSGDCLTSGGMVFLTFTFDTIEVHPNAGYTIRISIPASHNIIDKEMQVYVAKEKNGVVRWTLTNMSIMHDKTRGRYYYEFETDSIRGFNIDKTIRARCEEDGPLVKVKGFKKCSVYMTYPNEMYLSKGIPVRSRIYSLVKTADNKVPRLTVIAGEDPYSYIASGPLPELKYKKNKNMYVLKRKYFRLYSGPGTSAYKQSLSLCNYLNM